MDGLARGHVAQRARSGGTQARRVGSIPTPCFTCAWDLASSVWMWLSRSEKSVERAVARSKFGYLDMRMWSANPCARTL